MKHIHQFFVGAAFLCALAGIVTVVGAAINYPWYSVPVFVLAVVYGIGGLVEEALK